MTPGKERVSKRLCPRCTLSLRRPVMDVVRTPFNCSTTTCVFFHALPSICIFKSSLFMVFHVLLGNNRALWRHGNPKPFQQRCYSGPTGGIVDLPQGLADAIIRVAVQPAGSWRRLVGRPPSDCCSVINARLIRLRASQRPSKMLNFEASSDRQSASSVRNDGKGSND